MYSARSHILQEKPHSLSYQAEIFPICLPIVFVRLASTIAELGLWLKSTDTNFSFVISTIPLNDFLDASKILAKHDENYMPPEVKEALKEK